MRRPRLSRLHLLLIVPLTFLVFSAHLTWTQEKPSASETPTQLSSLAAQFVAGPEGFHPAYENLSSPFAPNQGQAPARGENALTWHGLPSFDHHEQRVAGAVAAGKDRG